MGVSNGAALKLATPENPFMKDITPQPWSMFAF